MGIGEARRDVREGRLLPVPVHLRGTGYAGAKRLGHGEAYQYAHDEPDAVAAQDYLGVERSTIGPWTEASSGSWPSGWPRSAPACGKAARSNGLQSGGCPDSGTTLRVVATKMGLSLGQRLRIDEFQQDLDLRMEALLHRTEPGGVLQLGPLGVRRASGPWACGPPS